MRGSRTLLLWLGGILLLGALVFIGAVAARPRGPSAMGRSLDSWLLDLNDTSNNLQARLAIRAMGTKAVPYLIENIEGPETSAQKLERNIGSWLHRNVLAPKERRWISAEACGVLGTNAVAALPALTEMLRMHKEPEEAIIAILAVSPTNLSMLTNEFKRGDVETKRALAYELKWAKLSPDVAAEGLIIATKDTDPEVRKQAAWSLGVLGGAPEEAVPALILSLNDPDAQVREQAAGALELFGGQATSAVPALVEFIRTNNNGYASRAATALKAIDPAALSRIEWPHPFEWKNPGDSKQ